MAVSMARSGPTATISVSVNVADLIAAVQAEGLTPAQAKLAAARRALSELTEAVEAAGQTDAELDGRVATIQAVVNRLKASRLTGTL